jgi:hypothetical protein
MNHSPSSAGPSVNGNGDDERESHPWLDPIDTCRHGSWQRLRPLLAALHLGAHDGPEALVAALQAVPAAQQGHAQAVLRAISLRPWHLEPLSGRYGGNPALGLRLRTLGRRWWLRFAPAAGELRIRQIERLD